MFELLKSFLFAVLMVPVVTTLTLALIYGLGKTFNLISKNTHSSSPEKAKRKLKE